MREIPPFPPLLLCGHEGDAGLVSCLSKCLVSGTETRKAAGVGGEEAGHAAGPVVDLKLRPVGLVGAGLGAVVPVVGSCQQMLVFIARKYYQIILTAGNLPDWTRNISVIKLFHFVVTIFTR